MCSEVFAFTLGSVVYWVDVQEMEDPASVLHPIWLFTAYTAPLSVHDEVCSKGSVPERMQLLQGTPKGTERFMTPLAHHAALTTGETERSDCLSSLQDAVRMKGWSALRHKYESCALNTSSMDSYISSLSQRR